MILRVRLRPYNGNRNAHVLHALLRLLINCASLLLIVPMSLVILPRVRVRTIVAMARPGKQGLYALLWIISSCSLFPVPAEGQLAQEGSKLVGSGAVGNAYQGASVSISGDGSTAIIGGWSDNNGVGAAWVFTRTSGIWTQQGPKLVGSGAVGNSSQGVSVALSEDGNTAIIGGYGDSPIPGNNSVGAAWVFTRSDGVWTQQGPKLVGSGASLTYGDLQGWSVGLSGDGNTAIVGGYADDAWAGAAWVFTRSGGLWTQQGPKLVGNDAAGAAYQGTSVALSGDGNTAIVGGQRDNVYVGAAWVFARTGAAWSQQGPKLVGTGAIGNAGQGWAVGLSGDGSTAIVGGYFDNNAAGAAWIFTGSGGVWSQEGPKLVGSGAVGNASQGQSVSLSEDGNTAIVGGYTDNGYAGAAWVYTSSAGVWTQQGSKLVGSGAAGTALQGVSVALSEDGSTAVVGGSSDKNDVGAAWVFTSLPTPAVTSSPTSLSFTYQPPGLAPLPGSVQVSGNFVGLSFVTAVTTQDGGNWLSVTPTSGMTPSTFSVSIDPTALAAGTYDGTVTVTGTNGAAGSTTITVTLTVALPGPVISSVENGASFQSGFSPNSWLTITGNNLASVASDTWQIVNGKLPTELDGVSVMVGGQPAYVYYVSPGQVNVVVPNIAAGATTVVLTNANGTSTPFNSTVLATEPAFFLWSGNYAVASHSPSYSYAVKDGEFPGLTTVQAHPGDVIILWGTGFGPTNPAAPVGVEVPSTPTYGTTTLPTVTVGGVTATVYGAALASGFTGLYQIAIQVPVNLANGDYPVIATIGGVASANTALLTVQQ